MKKVNFETPLDYVVLEREQASDTTVGGLDLMSTGKDKPLRGVVIAIGNKMSENTIVKMGRTMLYKKYGATETVIDGRDLVIIRESDLLLGL